MIVAPGTFSEERFDPKAWVNATCEARPADESVDKYLSEVEMKLQLLADDITSSLEELSSNALLRVPRAVRETKRVRDDALSLRGTVGGILQRLEQAEGSSAQSVAALARVDIVKQRMEAARDTLQDAAGLAQLSASVEEVFASGDLPRVAQTLASMRRCLAMVGEVPEFMDVKRQLASLEDRLEQMVQPRLVEALTQRQVDPTQGLRDILVAIGRYAALEQHYTRVRLRPLRRMWDEYDVTPGTLTAAPSPASGPPGVPPPAPTPFLDWLPRFYDEVLLVLEQEARWCAETFPEEHHLLLPKLLTEAMGAIGASFTARIDAALQDLPLANRSGVAGRDASTSPTGSPQSPPPLATLIALHGMTAAFARNIQNVLTASGTATSDLVRVLQATYAPFEAYKNKYGELEKAQLVAGVAAMGIAVSGGKGSAGDRVGEMEKYVGRMEASVPEAMTMLEAAVERCLSLTGGSEAEALLGTLDEVMLQYCAQMVSTIATLRSLCVLNPKPTPGEGGVERVGGQATGVGNRVAVYDLEEEGGGDGGRVGGEEEEWRLVEHALKLLGVAETLSSRAAVFEASLRATLGRLAHKLMPPEIGDGVEEMGELDTSREDSGSGRGGGGGGYSSLDSAALRLQESPEKAQRLASLFEQATDPRFHALPRTAHRVAALQDAVSDLVYDVLIAKVRQSLTGVSTRGGWSAEEEDAAFDLPSFSAYPGSYITVIGEYLLQLPQQLEPLVLADQVGVGAGGGGEEGGAGGEGEDPGYFATEWMFKVAEGAIALYVEQLRAIPSLSKRGAQQLAADIEYMCNVLAALSMAQPLVLGTFHACLTVPKEEFATLVANEAVPGGSLDPPTAKLVGKMRVDLRE